VPNDLVTFCAVKTKLKKITVIHDLKSLNEKSQTSLSYLIFWVYYYLLIKFSNIVVAISKYTKEDILRYFKCFSDDKIKVVYNSVNLSTQDSTEQIAEYNDYILFVNTLLPYKNVMTLLKSFVLLKHKIALNLIIVGQTTSYWESEVMSFIRKEKLDDRIIHLENISDASLYALYKHASLFVTTSLKEGFGYTPIEAAMCCCPVVSSKCEALGDTTQNLLYYYEPAKDEVKLSEQILHVLNNPPSKDKLQHIAKIYRESYSIEKQYKSLIHILDKD
jgi:glycosyltransferase involved in cell wall biosynthesis